MEIKTGTPVKKWDDVNGVAADVSREVVVTDAGIKLPQEMDPNILGNVRRGLEDQLEQNDNMIGDGVINNVNNDIDDNANGIPDEKEKSAQELEAERDALARDYYEAQESLEHYMLITGGASDDSDRMAADVRAMRNDLKELDGKIEMMKETKGVEVDNKGEKSSLLEKLHDCKSEVDDKSCRILAPELVL